MLIKKIDNTTNFKGLIRIIPKSPEEFLAQANGIIQKMPPEYRGLSAAAGSTGLGSSSSSAISGSSVINTAATTSDVVASAFFAKASGVDSYGIVPSTMAKISPYATPATMASSAQHPETAGSVFSGLGAWLHSHFKFTDNRTKKIPS